MRMSGMPPESPDPSISDSAFVTEEFTDVALAPTPSASDAVVAGALPSGKPRSSFRRGLEVFLENKLAVTGTVIVAIMVVFCFIGPLFYHGNTTVVDFAHETLPPGGGHPLGTDSRSRWASPRRCWPP